jgi:hypothetical protein
MKIQFYQNDAATYRMYHSEVSGKSLYIHANKNTKEAEIKILIAKNKYTCSPLREALSEGLCGFLALDAEQHRWAVLIAKHISKFFCG